MSRTSVVPTIFTAEDRFSSIVRQMSTGVSSFSNNTLSAVQRVNNRMNGMFNSMDRLSQVALGGGVSAGFLVAGKAVMDYEDALASLESVTDVDSNKFKGQIESIAKDTNKSAIEVSKSFEIVGSAMSEYLDNPKALGQITNASMILSKASGDALEPSIDNLTSIMNQFSLGADKATFAVNRLSAGEIVGSVRTARLAQEMKDVGGIAYFNGIQLGEMTAAMEVMGKRIPHDQLGRVSRNLVLFMSSAKAAPKPALAAMERLGISTDVLMNKNISFEKRLRELSKATKDAIAMEALFGKENTAGATQLLNNIDLYSKWTNTINNTNKAQDQAATKSNTLSKGIEAIKNQFINAVVSGDENNNMLSRLKDTAFFLADNMGSIVKWTGRLIGAFLTFKAIIGITTAATWLYNASLGVMAVVNGASAMALRGNTIALGAYRIAATIATGAQWLLNAAMSANPIGLFIVAITALIGLITLAVVKFDSFGATILFLMGPIGLVISAFKLMYDHWESIKKSFETGSIFGGIKRIGIVLFDLILKPLQQVLGFLKDMPLIGESSGRAFEKIKGFRSELNLVTPREKKLLDSPQMNQVKATANANVNGQIGINVSAKQGVQADITQRRSLGIPINITSTQGAF